MTDERLKNLAMISIVKLEKY